jgi:integrase/recombinase XerD
VGGKLRVCSTRRQGHGTTGRSAGLRPFLPERAQELRTYLGKRTAGFLFETNRATRYAPRRLQQIMRETAEQAQITRRVYPHLLQHSVGTML